uniref:Plastin-3 n=1 Tax=Panagrellus redivivus TaxID=6233 RepID=A0A7E4VXM6_PANRE
MITPEQLTDLHEEFNSINVDGSGSLKRSDVGAALKIIGIDIPGYQVREILARFGEAPELSYNEFVTIFTELMEEKTAAVNQWKKGIVRVHDAYQVQGIAEHGADEIVHTIRIAEEIAFSNWINSKLAEDGDLKRLLPVTPDNGDLYRKVQDGIIICKLINIAQPETIDERAINKKNLNTYTKLENLTLSLMSAQAIGCNIVNIDADDISKGKPHLVLGLIWQIIRVGLFAQINLEHVPGMFRLLNEGETLDELRRLTPEQILLRWVNYHLNNTDTNRRMANFTSDIVDSEIYTYLLNEIAPREAGLSMAPLHQKDNIKRASSMLNEAAKIDCRSFVTPNDVAGGNYKLNLAFVANLFNKYPHLPEPGADEVLEEEVVEETREEKMYRNWMNSLGVKPYVGYLYTDLQNGLVIFQLYDQIRKGVVDWSRVVTLFRKMQGFMDQIQNGNYAIEVGRQIGFSLVGIQGKDIYDGNRTLTLALVWQLMRAYTLAILARCTNNGSFATDKEIVAWSNQKLQTAGKTSQFKSFMDSTISSGIVVLDLIDAIKPGTIDYSLVHRGETTAEKLENAKYAITSGRKIGAKIYALPEDIVEVKSKMVMTVFACLMARDYMPSLGPTTENGENGTH